MSKEEKGSMTLLIKQFVLDLLFDDGVVHIVVEPPVVLSDSDFDTWSVGVTNGIAAYIAISQSDRNFKKSETVLKDHMPAFKFIEPSEPVLIIHKHTFKFIEPSETNLILYFYCTECQDLGQIPRAQLRDELLGH